ncbi:MAG: hypothetical protein U5L73_16845 [Rhodoferax sp.]|uniref:hypothetical protein n=1 Tax=Rhodoferax sp. TaxID=50421 RepID=UPI002ACEF504|nr:hypothetical protein [Rhodoferax sp.]MDZ7893408.1 hypothetical protein [Rhodoferax sp.]
MSNIFQLCSPVWLQRGLRATVLTIACAVVAPAMVQAQGVTATLDNAASTERLIAEFGSWIGNPQDADQVVTTLRSGRPTATAGAASQEPATGPLGYGEVRLALKLAQGALAQQGVTNPDAGQLQAALHGGVLRTPQGEQAMDGVLPQKAQGTGWATMAGRYGLTTEDLLPPPGKAVVVKRAKPPSAKAKASSKTKAKSGAKAKASAKGKAKASTKKAVKKTAKPAAKAKSVPAKKKAAKN